MFTGTVRRDGYCAFRADNPWATFPSLSVAWSFADVKVLQWEPMSTGKLRVSWGKNGNRQLKDPYLAFGKFGFGYRKYHGILYRFRLCRYEIPQCRPFVQCQPAMGKDFLLEIRHLDLGFLNDRISGSLEALRHEDQ